MPSNNGLVTRHSKLVNLHNPARHPRPPTLVTAASVDHSSQGSSEKRATWSDLSRRDRLRIVAWIVGSMATYAVIVWWLL